VKAAKNAGFFVVATTTIYSDSDVRDVAALFERLHTMHVDGYILSPHYPARQIAGIRRRCFMKRCRERFREASEFVE